MSNYQIFGVISSILGVILAVPSFFILRWMNRVEKLLTELNTKVHQTEVREAKIFGKIESVCDISKKASESMGALNASVGKIWDIIIRKGYAESRPSDGFARKG
jgi:hypothetical protein